MRGSNLHLAFGTEVIYDDAEFYIGDNDKTGIVGVNGAGKTTLFRVILKEQELDGGQIVTGNARIGYLPQEIDFSEQEKTVWDYLFDARPINKIESELNSIYERLASAEGEEQAYLLERMEKLQARLEDLDFYNAEGLLLDLISSMKIDSDLLDRAVIAESRRR